jgi:formate C-acetyltransferase
MNVIKDLLKTFLNYFGLLEATRKYYKLCLKECNFEKKTVKVFWSLLKNLQNVNIIIIKNQNDILLKEAIIFKEICKKAKLAMKEEEVFFYYPDFFILPISKNSLDLYPLGNITVNYAEVLNKGILGIEKEIKQLYLNNDKNTFYYALLEICEGIKIYSNRVKSFIKKKFPKKKELINCLDQVPLLPARNFFEALQCILIINSFLWMAGHHLIGLGRLDIILYPFYSNDINKGILNKDKAFFLIKEFLKSLHKGFKYKSNVLPGDTGQVIVLGGKDNMGIDQCNELTFIFMNVMKDLKLPDPKIVLRVHENTPDEVWYTAMDLLSEGLGYPLFSNDDVIIPALQKFGYEVYDSYNYVVSACWEPHIPGVSLDQNNVLNLNLLEPLIALFNSNSLDNINSFDEFVSLYQKELIKYVETSIKRIEKIKFKPSPLLSLLTGCREKDISEGGAKYNHLGILTVGLPNVVNSLLNINRWLNDKKFSLSEIKAAVKTNFKKHTVLLYDARNKGLKFGNDDDKVIELTNSIVNTLVTVIENKVNPLGGKYKIGYSSPAFVELGKYLQATPDGRNDKEPLGVHISPTHGKITLLELFNFSSKLNYTNAFNGAVTDIIIDAFFLKRYFDTFVNLFKSFILIKGAQLQCNVLDYKKLLDAFNNPDKYPNLIVRVWGFSTFFKDLPIEYQQLILQRAKQYGDFYH